MARLHISSLRYLQRSNISKFFRAPYSLGTSSSRLRWMESGAVHSARVLSSEMGSSVDFMPVVLIPLAKKSHAFQHAHILRSLRQGTRCLNRYLPRIFLRHAVDRHLLHGNPVNNPFGACLNLLTSSLAFSIASAFACISCASSRAAWTRTVMGNVSRRIEEEASERNFVPELTGTHVHARVCTYT